MDAKSIWPHLDIAWNTLRMEFYLIFVRGKHGYIEGLGAAHRITPVFAFKVWILAGEERSSMRSTEVEQTPSCEPVT